MVCIPFSMTSILASAQPDHSNPFFQLPYESALELLGEDYFDRVAAAQFPTHILRFRNDALLSQLGLDPPGVTDTDFITAFGQFQGPQPCLALRYHGYQFGEYNPQLGDGRGFLYGQVRGLDGELYDFGTKGSGTTPYSRGGDGRLTLKGGVREVLAAETLYAQGVRTSRCLSLIETGESLWRGDEPSPTRSSVMVRFSRSHIRFGTFERLHFFGRRDLILTLMDHVIEVYYPHLRQDRDRYSRFYSELVQRVAELVAQWMAAGFCHAVLNTDNMSITGESFDYGPYAFIPTLNPTFTAAYFDYYGRYCYGHQPIVCQGNLELLQQPLGRVIPKADLEAGLAQFDGHYQAAYRERMLDRLGLGNSPLPEADELLRLTLQFLQASQLGYHDFFHQLTQQFTRAWWQDETAILSDLAVPEAEHRTLLEQWRSLYHRLLQHLSQEEMTQVGQRLRQHNPPIALLRPVIESVWEPIAQADNWLPFYDLLQQIQTPAQPFHE